MNQLDFKIEYIDYSPVDIKQEHYNRLQSSTEDLNILAMETITLCGKSLKTALFTAQRAIVYATVVMVVAIAYLERVLLGTKVAYLYAISKWLNPKLSR